MIPRQPGPEKSFWACDGARSPCLWVRLTYPPDEKFLGYCHSQIDWHLL